MGIKRSIYSKKSLIFIRIVAVLAIIVLIISTSRILIQGDEYNLYGGILSRDMGTIILNCSSIICFSVLVIYPEKLFFLSIISFIYSLFILIDEPNNQMGILMAVLCYYTLHVRNFFHKNRIIKKIIFVVCIAGAFATEIRFGFCTFLNSFFDSLAFLFVMLLAIYFFREKNIIEITNNISERKLNLFSFSGTRKEDVQLLQLVLEKKQYLEISQIVYRSEGTVRNRLNRLYDILGVADRIGFVTTYTGYEIIYDEADTTEK